MRESVIPRRGHHIGGRAVDSGTGEGVVRDPATGEVVATVGYADVAVVDQGVASAVDASAGWAATPPAKRAAVMFAFRELVRRHGEELAGLITLENGKTLEDSRGEVARGLESVEFACGAPENLKGEHSTNVAVGIDVHSAREPLGVVACVTPFNFPVMVPLWMLANAISCGNAVVLKPSEKDPSAPLRLAELFTEAGLPDGVLNVVNGDREVVERLLTHPDIDGVSFVGSTPVAKEVYRQAAAAGKRVQALGGAKNHMVVFPDADLDEAAAAAVTAGYGAAGERCMAVSVVVAVGDVGDDLVKAIVARAGDVAVGPGTQPGVFVGPLITAEHRDRVASYLDGAVEQGATVVLDGRDSPAYRGPGFFLAPSLIDGVDTSMSCYRDEIFGPVLSVVRVPDEAAALRLVNENPFGNGVAIFTGSGGVARRFGTGCKAGMVGINVPIPVPVAQFSFGGWKSSLFGDSHMYGPDGVRFFTRQKVTTTRWGAA